MLLNKKEYPDNGVFTKLFHEKYFNLKIYPLVNDLEKEAGLLSDFAEAYKDSGSSAKYLVFGEETKVSFINSNIFFILKRKFVLTVIRRMTLHFHQELSNQLFLSVAHYLDKFFLSF